MVAVGAVVIVIAVRMLVALLLPSASSTVALQTTGVELSLLCV